MTTVLVIGATSAIAEAVARRFVEAGKVDFFLVGRRQERLDAIVSDLTARGASASCLAMDVNETDRHGEMLAAAQACLSEIDVVLIAHGTLPDQAACQNDVALTLQEFQTNAVSTVALLTRIAEILEAQRRGTIAVVTSVAGDRGRQSNYVYGAAKAAVDTFLEGMRQRLHKVGVRVVSIRPGFIDTPMTAELDKGLLWARPEQVAGRIHRAILRGKDVVYVPWFWWPIMRVIRSIPRPIFKAIKL